jgi:hypothetical protein
MKSIPATVRDHDRDIKQLQKDVSELTERYIRLERAYNEKVGKSGNTMPPTRRPAMLRELELGVDPDGLEKRNG